MEGLKETTSRVGPGVRPKKRKRRRGLKVGIVLLVIALGVSGYFIYRSVAGPAAAPIQYTTQAAQKVTIEKSVSGSGNVAFSASESVASKVAGTVSGLRVALGDKVTKGQILYTVVNDQLDTAVIQATNSYKQALNNLQSSELSLEKAQKSFDDLQTEYLKERSGPSAQNTGIQLVSLNVTPPSTTTTTAPRPTSTTNSPSTTLTTISDLDLKIAEQQVTSAQLSVSVAQTNVTLAQMSLDDAKKNASEKQVTSPIDGTITTLNLSEGDSVSASSSSASAANGSSNNVALVVTDLSQWTVSVSLSETDVTSVMVGQKATLTFDALPNVSLTGKVTRLDAAGSNSSGVVSYSATITPDAGNDAIKGGMTVTVAIITLVAADVIAVPNAAVKTASDGSNYVQLLENGKPVDRTVTIGASDDTYTEIKSGLTEGQAVITRTVNPNASTSTTVRGTGGGGFPTGGGGGVFIGPGG